MDAFSRASSSLLLAVAALAGCVEQVDRVPKVTSFRVEVVGRTDFGNVDVPLDFADRAVTVNIQAVNDLGEDDTSLNTTLSTYAHYLGTLTPVSGADVSVVNGAGTASFEIPHDYITAYGPTVVWFADDQGDSPSYATGTTPTYWYRLPYLADESTPDMASPSTWLETSPLIGKQVKIEDSAYGASGRLIVNGVFSQGYGLSDVECENCDATSCAGPCHYRPFAHVYVYTFGRPRDEKGAAIVEGQLVDWVMGGSAEFNGFTELSFPQTMLLREPGAACSDAAPCASGWSCAADGFCYEDVPLARPDLLPAPPVVDGAWFPAGPLSADGMIHLEEQEAAPIAVVNGVFCALDEDWDTYSQWRLDVGNGCDSKQAINVVTKESTPDFDPTSITEGAVFDQVVGVIRPVNIGTFNIWIIYPRGSADIVQ